MNLISEGAHLDITKSKIQSLPTKSLPEDIKKIYIKTGLYRQYLEQYTSDDFKKILNNYDSNTKLFDNLKRLKKGSVLNLSELNEFSHFIEYIGTFIKLLDILNKDFNQSSDVQDLRKNFIRELRRLIDKDGDIDYMNHPEISKIYKEIQSIEIKIRHTLTSKINDQNFNKCLQFNNFDIIYDRYVIPVKTDSYNNSIGSIISKSESGNTLFVELYEVKQLANSRLQLQSSMDELLHKICIRLTESLKRNHSLLNYLSNLLSEVDYYISTFEFYTRFGLVEPEISETKEIILRNFYHPLIKNPVKNSIEIDSSKNGLAITGPNTGGKTASLKSITLSILLLHKGLYVPATYAKLYPYENIFYFGNDQQNLIEGESSFSSEAKSYIQLLSDISENNLIIMDEIFNSTSSEEASALALSFFNYISSSSNSHILVSTHHQMLKTFLHQRDDFISSHVEFDSELNKPTYKLNLSGPGSSMAIKVFQRLSDSNIFKDQIIAFAENILDKKMINYESLLQELSYKESVLNKEISKFKDLNTELKNQKNAQAGLLKLELKDQTQIHKMRLEKLYKNLNDDVKNVKKDNLKATRRKLEVEINNADPSLRKPQIFHETKTEDAINTISVGRTYYCHKFNSDVKILEVNINSKTALVTKGSIKISVPFSSLKKTLSTLKSPNEVHVHYSSSQRANIKFDCRGKRLNEFESIVELAVSDLLVGKVPFVEIIHGHGDGILKSWLIKYIRDNKDIKIVPNDDGNDGSTRLVIS